MIEAVLQSYSWIANYRHRWSDTVRSGVVRVVSMQAP